MRDNKHNHLIANLLAGQRLCTVEAERTDNVEHDGEMHIQADSYKEKNKVVRDQTDHVSSLMF